MSPTKKNYIPSKENSQEKDILIDDILLQLQDIDVAWYLKDEVRDLLKYLHFYKIKNVYQNIEALKEYLILLDSQSTNQIHKLEYDASRNHELFADHDVQYYVSKKWLDHVGENKIHQKIWENDYNLSYIMQGIKWLLLLTADEFCNATPTRMSINRMLWEKELNTVKK